MLRSDEKKLNRLGCSEKYVISKWRVCLPQNNQIMKQEDSKSLNFNHVSSLERVSLFSTAHLRTQLPINTRCFPIALVLLRTASQSPCDIRNISLSPSISTWSTILSILSRRQCFKSPPPLLSRLVNTHSLRSEAGLLYRTQSQDDYGLAWVVNRRSIRDKRYPLRSSTPAMYSGSKPPLILCRTCHAVYGEACSWVDLRLARLSLWKDMELIFRLFRVLEAKHYFSSSALN